MPGFTVSAAARLCRVDRRTLQRAIQAGRLPLDAEHCLSREALIAAGYLDATPPQETPQYTPQSMPQVTPQDAPRDTSQGMPQELEQATALLALLEQLTAAISALHAEVQSLRDDLRQMPQSRRRRERTAPHGTPQRTPQETPHYSQGPDAALAPQETPQASPQILGTYDPQAAVARIQALRRQGLSFARIAAQLDAEGLPTRYGLPWQHSSVRHLFTSSG